VSLPRSADWHIQYILLDCSLHHNHYCCLLLSPMSMCMLHLVICACSTSTLQSSPIACPLSSVLNYCLLCIWSNICASPLFSHFPVLVFSNNCVHFASFAFPVFLFSFLLLFAFVLFTTYQ